MVKTHRFKGVKYDIDIGACDGSCDAPRLGKPSLRINLDRENTRRFLEVAIHESLHACHWRASEESVDKTATDIAKFLWRMGYRLK